MDTQLHYAESRIAEVQQSLCTAGLEKSYEEALLQIQNTHEEERSRQLRVRIQLLEDENDVLQDQLAEADENLELSERAEDDLRDQLADADVEAQRLQNELRIKTREVATLKAEIHSLNNVNADSTKLLTEKLALSRELANLKPELEHVRSQATSQQSALSEKLALQRQLSSLQVELETERRALERAKANDSKQSDQDAKLKIQLDEIRKELAKEKSDRQKKDKQVAKEAAEWETQRTILDSKLEAFRTKLRSSKDQLKETQEELQKAQAAVYERRVSVVDNPRKRNIARFDPDATIGTPGDFHAAKRNKRASTALPGDKSTFSITPFLNRTLNIAPESPEAEEAAAKEISDDQRTEKENAVPATATEVTEQDPPFPVISRGSTKPAGAKAGALSIATQKGNSRAKARKPSSLSILEKVAEEGNEENEGDEKVDEPQTSTAILKGKAKAAPAETQNAQPKKKHKLLGSNRERTLFDDDDAEAPKDTRKNLFGGTIGGLNMRGGRALSIPKGGLRVGLGPTEFSPLKKERKSAAL